MRCHWWMWEGEERGSWCTRSQCTLYKCITDYMPKTLWEPGCSSSPMTCTRRAARAEVSVEMDYIQYRGITWSSSGERYPCSCKSPALGDSFCEESSYQWRSQSWKRSCPWSPGRRSWSWRRSQAGAPGVGSSDISISFLTAPGMTLLVKEVQEAQVVSLVLT